VDATTPAVLHLPVSLGRGEVAGLCEDVRALLQPTREGGKTVAIELPWTIPVRSVSAAGQPDP
ncbi:hypothetical protein ACWDAZ_34405, partial [Streptomyces sp. NPDC001215]